MSFTNALNLVVTSASQKVYVRNKQIRVFLRVIFFTLNHETLITFTFSLLNEKFNFVLIVRDVRLYYRSLLPSVSI